MASTQTESSPKGESFAALFEESVARADQLKEGEIVQGTIVGVTRDNVVIDIGYKSEGVLPASQFTSPTGELQIKIGDKIDVLVEAKETDDGLVQLSKEKADKLKVWDEISAACERDELIEGTITTRVKGGLSVTISGGVKAFLPG
ncbi:MAG: S1 RNA-binding domain-containing protein, partial [Myxococcales bacterium]|nr:S1 RNA-binding domain-containing protein [Myxococcales bacterium]